MYIYIYIRAQTHIYPICAYMYLQIYDIQWACTHVARSDVCATLGNSALVDVAIEVA